MADRSRRGADQGEHTMSISVTGGSLRSSLITSSHRVIVMSVANAPSYGELNQHANRPASAVGPGLLELEQDRDVGRLEQSQRDDRHHADDDVAGDDPVVARAAREHGSGQMAELPAAGQRHRHDDRHDQQHLRHHPVLNSTARAATSCPGSARSPAEEQVDDGPGGATGACMNSAVRSYPTRSPRPAARTRRRSALCGRFEVGTAIAPGGGPS
jgi:hypothetical protein